MKVKYKLVPVIMGMTILCTGCSMNQAGKYYGKAIDSYEQGEYKQAGDYFAKAISENADKAEYHIDYGFALIQLKEYDQAREQFMSIIMDKDIPMVLSNNKKAYRGIGISYLNEQKPADAIENFDKALELNADSSLDLDIMYYKASALQQQGNLEDASKIYTDILAKNDQDAQTYCARANIYRVLGDYESASADYDKAIALDPDNFDIYFGKFAALKELGNETEAAAVLEKASNIKIDTDYDKFQLAKVHYYQGDTERAQIELDYSVSNGYTQAYFYLGEIYLLQNDYETAILNFKQYANEGNVMSALYYNQLLTCYLQTEQIDLASDCLKKAKSYSDVSISDAVLKNEIIYLEKTGDFSTAYKKMKQYIAKHPEDEGAKKDYYFLQTRVDAADTADNSESSQSGSKENEQTAVKP